MHTPEYWIAHLQLKPHSEGGFYKETYRSQENIPARGLPGRFDDSRSFSTAIYFLLRSQDRSRFHRIKSDELWHYHAGSTLSIFVLHNPGLSVFKLGPNPDQGESLQVVIPAGVWFGAKIIQPDSYTLSSCTVAPGFDFRDFELADRTQLTHQFPEYRDVIEMLA